MMQQIKAQHLVRQPAFPPRHRTEHDDARLGLLFSAPSPSRPRRRDTCPRCCAATRCRAGGSRAIDRILSLMARQLGTPATSVLSAGTQELEVNCAIPKSLVSWALRRPGNSAPAVESPQTKTRGRRFRSTQLSAKRGFMTEIEQALMNPPFRRIRSHIRHLANFRRQPKIEPASLHDHAACRRDQRHARTQADDPGRPGRPNRNGISMKR